MSVLNTLTSVRTKTPGLANEKIDNNEIYKDIVNILIDYIN